MQFTPTGRCLTLDIDVLRHGFVPAAPAVMVHIDFQKFIATFQGVEIEDKSSGIIGESPIQQARRNMRPRGPLSIPPDVQSDLERFFEDTAE